ncbi:TIGR03086 family metal-binding protein [Nonomuraea sp. B12E4]|uniref:TIGR03086 family metal-binding protein n=1 Tax=Nonomuraea sp. B12E4 TaxID=3153564 RepID=UPI00325DBDC3
MSEREWTTAKDANDSPQPRPHPSSAWGRARPQEASSWGRGQASAARPDGREQVPAGGAGDCGRATIAGAALLERAIDYTLGSLRIVTPDALCHTTPCADWNLRELLDHMNDTLQTLNEAATGQIAPYPKSIRAHGANPALALRDGARDLLGHWAAGLANDLISIADRHLTSPMVAAIGAIEITVHGWDISKSCGEHHPIPPSLAEELLDLARLFITRRDRPSRFAPQLMIPPRAPAQNHLLAYLGRDPGWLPTPDPAGSRQP